MRKLIFIFLILIAIFFGYYSFKILKTKFVVNSYFNQGRWRQLMEEYRKVKKTAYSSIFFGDSMTENFKEYMPTSDSIINMGISGDFTQGLIERIDNVTNFQPNQVFIMIGINDIIEKIPLNEIEKNYIIILETIKKKSPKTKIYIQSTLPTYGLNSFLSSSKGINKTVIKLNDFLKKTADKMNIVFIDMYPEFVNESNELRQEVTTDGIHLNMKGYQLWKSFLRKYLLIP